MYSKQILYEIFSSTISAKPRAYSGASSGQREVSKFLSCTIKGSTISGPFLKFRLSFNTSRTSSAT